MNGPLEVTFDFPYLLNALIGQNVYLGITYKGRLQNILE